MAAYVIVDIQVNDSQGYVLYKEQAAPTVEQYGGRYVVRSGKVEALEGDWVPTRFVILEFPSVEQAKRWWASPEYCAVKQIRYDTADSKMIVVEGL